MKEAYKYYTECWQYYQTHFFMPKAASGASAVAQGLQDAQKKAAEFLRMGQKITEETQRQFEKTIPESMKVLSQGGKLNKSPGSP